MDILEQIGITKEELIERIVEKALGLTADSRCYDSGNGEPAWEEIPFSSVIDKKINDVISASVKAMEPMIQERVHQLIEERMAVVLTTPFQRTDRWGAPVGDPTTIRDLIADKTQAYWTETVDRQGRTDGYDRKPRHEWYAAKVMEEFYQSELQSEVKKLAKDLKDRIPKTIADEITQTVVAHLR